MKYRFNAAIFVRGDHAFIEIPFNVREEADGRTFYFERKNTAMWRSNNAILKISKPAAGRSDKEFWKADSPRRSAPGGRRARAAQAAQGRGRKAADPGARTYLSNGSAAQFAFCL